MCGIIGIVNGKNSENLNIPKLLSELFKVSESRGQDSSGLALEKDGKIHVYKEAKRARDLIKTREYQELTAMMNGQLSIIAHSRMETNGTYSLSYNNQPVVKDGCVTIHNGIIVNDDAIWKKYKSIKKEFGVDTEVFNSLLNYKINESQSLLKALNETLDEIEGAYSFATIFQELSVMLLVTNTGSFYYYQPKEKDYFIFASEANFLRWTLEKMIPDVDLKSNIKHLHAGEGIIIDTKTLDLNFFEIGQRNHLKTTIIDTPKKIRTVGKEITFISEDPITKKNEEEFKNVQEIVQKEYERNKVKIAKLRRCVRCVLPETMPFISFDNDGVCNYCQSHTKIEIKGKDALIERLKDYEFKKNGPNCVVAFSGGRDSSYTLHYAKNVLKLNPLAFSYDWGMLTDLGRRNQARMTGQLGVEHILVSANINQKRSNIRKNVSAWLSKPHLGTIPLFMAGDKQYFYYANKILENYNLDLLIMGENYYEKTIFKNGFAGIKQNNFMAYHVNTLDKLRMLFFYAKEFAKNPKFINSSVFDSIGAFFSYYGTSHKYLNLYEYIRWDEDVINSTLKNYGWELSPDTNTTWRIGDGTAAFYNYIYYTVAGFSEIETFNSNLIRDGIITRKTALNKILELNAPRLDSILWYCNTIKINLKNAIKIINGIPKLYDK